MEWKKTMRKWITVWKLRLEERNQDSAGVGEIYGLTSTFHHVSAVFGSS